MWNKNKKTKIIYTGGPKGTEKKWLGEWRQKLKEICNKEAEITVNRQNGTYIGVIPRTLLQMSWRATLKDVVSVAVREEGVADGNKTMVRAIHTLVVIGYTTLSDLLREFGIEVTGTLDEFLSQLQNVEEKQKKTPNLVKDTPTEIAQEDAT